MSWREEIVEFLEREARPTHKAGHQPRLYALTLEIASREPGLEYDDDVVFAASFLHDLGVFEGHRPKDPVALAGWDHVGYACGWAPEILQKIGFPEAKIEAVLMAIREHQPQDVPRSVEAMLLRDADILEQLGAIGAARTLAKVGSDTRFELFSQAAASLRRSLSELPGMIRLRGTYELAEARVVALRGFLEALDAEAGVHLDR